MANFIGSPNTLISNINENVLLYFLLNNTQLDIKQHTYDSILNLFSDDVKELININIQKMLELNIDTEKISIDVFNTIIKSYLCMLEFKTFYKIKTISDGVITNKGLTQIQEFLDKHETEKKVYPKDHPADIVIKHANDIIGISLKQTKNNRKIGWKNPGIGTFQRIVNKTFNTDIHWNNEIKEFRESGINVLEQMRRDKILIDELNFDITKIPKKNLKYNIRDSTSLLYDPDNERWATPNSLCSFIYTMGKSLQELYSIIILRYYANMIKSNQLLFLNHLTDYWFMCKNQYPNYCKITAMGNNINEFNVDIEHLYSSDIINELQDNIGLGYCGKTGFVIGNLKEQKGLIYIRCKWNSTPIVTSFKFTASPPPVNTLLQPIDEMLEIDYNIFTDKNFTVDNLLLLQDYFISNNYKL